MIIASTIMLIGGLILAWINWRLMNALREAVILIFEQGYFHPDGQSWVISD